jgi:hypothetical protein
MSYIAITEAQSNPFAPLTSELIKQLRDNPIAIAAGAAGAPRIQTAAIQNSAVTAVKLATGNNERDWVRDRIIAQAALGIGSYAFLRRATGSGVTEAGTNRPGSELRQSNALGSSGQTPSGTWRCLGFIEVPTTGDDAEATTLWLRVS